MCFVYIIESLNAYILCCQNHKHKNFCIFICDTCNITKEIYLKENDFAVNRYNTEISGKCSKCI